MNSISLYLSASMPQKPDVKTVAYGRGLVLVWQNCDMLSPSNFVDDVIFAHSGRSLAVQKGLCVQSDSPRNSTGVKSDVCGFFVGARFVLCMLFQICTCVYEFSNELMDFNDD